MADNLNEELNTEPKAPANTSPLNEKYQQFVADNTANINQMYDANRQSQLTGLESAYTQNLSDATAQKQTIDQNYNRAANDLAVQYERNRANQNLQAQMNGLNVGTGSQMGLALGSEYNRDFGNLRGQQAQAQVEQDRQIANIEAQYRLQVQQAIADNDLARAAALVDEANNRVNQLTNAYQLQQQDLGNQAALLASAGDFSGYADMLGLTPDQTGLLQTQWTVQNPDLAYQSGMIDPNQYRAITGAWPRGYSPAGGGRGGGNFKNSYYYNYVLGNALASSLPENYTDAQLAAAVNEHEKATGKPISSDTKAALARNQGIIIP